MSYNISSIQIVASKDFGLPLARLEEMRAEVVRDERPGSSFLDEDWLKPSFGQPPATVSPDGYVSVNQLWWTSESSGYALDTFVSLLAEFDGTADIVLTWEGGDSFSGYRLADGVVTEHEIVMTLGAVKS